MISYHHWKKKAFSFCAVFSVTYKEVLPLSHESCMKTTVVHTLPGHITRELGPLPLAFSLTQFWDIQLPVKQVIVWWTDESYLFWCQLPTEITCTYT